MSSTVLPCQSSFHLSSTPMHHRITKCAITLTNLTIGPKIMAPSLTRNVTHLGGNGAFFIISYDLSAIVLLKI
jgi:hypothetical protein